MKKIFIIFCLTVPFCILHTTITFAEPQTVNKEPNQPAYLRPIPPEKLKEDLDFLFKTIEEVHPNMSAYTSKEEFSPLREKLYKSIDHPMKRLEFYKLIAPLFMALKFGHLQIDTPKEEFSDYHKCGGKVFPLILRWDGQDVVIDKNYGNETVPLGGTLISIDGQNAIDLVARFAKYRADEQKLGNMGHAAYNFGKYMWLENYPVRPWNLQIKDIYGNFGDFTVKPTPLDDIVEKARGDSAAKNWSYAYLQEYSASLVELNSFGGKLRKFKKFLRKTFRQIQEQKADYLIIDIRKNGGGNSNLGDALLDYITNKPFRQYERVEIKISKQVHGDNLEKIRKRFSDNSINIGSTFTNKGFFKKPSDNVFRFTGQVFLLIDKATFSAAMDFAAAVKCFNIGTLIGRETCDTPVDYGDTFAFNLPNSGLRCRAPFKYFVAACGKDDGRGVLPDYEVRQKPEDTAKGVDTTLQFTLNLIKSCKSATLSKYGATQ